MNTVILCGRAVRTPEFKDGAKPYVRFTLAVDRYREGTDFINCVAFGKTSESIMKWVQKGTKILIDGRIQTGSYENRDGKKVNTFDVIINNWEFAQSKGENSGFETVPDTMAEDELPWN